MENRNLFHTIVYVRKGSLYLKGEGQEWGVQQAKLVFIPIGSNMSLYTDNDNNVQGIYFGFPFGTAALDHLKSFETELAPGEQGMLQYYIDLNELQSTSVPSLFLYCCFLLLQYSISEAENKIGGKEPESVPLRFKKLVESHYREQHKVRFYADHLFISTGHLRKIIRAAYGMTPKNLLLQQLYSEAARLLTETTLPVKVIASELGFFEPSLFSVGFKIHTGLSPSQYRKHYNKLSDNDTEISP
ncbi:helix-turn-helix domain-containing protein [Flavobacterium rakeshii]|nr:AraC family transcriptional regulator [Flavobacterium rakeshii]